MLVLTTEASLENAEQLAEVLLQKGLVACVSLMPIVSHYTWQGRHSRSEEVQMLLKTQQPQLEELHHTLMALHSYDTPEWITLSALSQGPYALWCAAQLKGAGLREDGEPPAQAKSLEGGGPVG